MAAENIESTAVRQLDASNFSQAESIVNEYFATIEQGTTRAEVLKPEFFAHIATKLRPYTEIRVVCEDGSLYARLLVLAAERTWARVHVLEWHDLTVKDVSQSQAESVQTPATPATAARHRVEWKGPHHKWSVIRNADNEYVHEGDNTREDAELWLREHEKVTA